MEPTVTFTVDGIKIDTSTTYPKLNLSNHKEHKIGVDVSHSSWKAKEIKTAM